MKKRSMSKLLAAVLLVVGSMFGAGSATLEAHAILLAPPPFKTCRQMHRGIHLFGGLYRFTYGVAKSKKAAARQVAAGFHRPTISSGAYRNNLSLDRDLDGTACEVRWP